MKGLVTPECLIVSEDSRSKATGRRDGEEVVKSVKEGGLRPCRAKGRAPRPAFPLLPSSLP